MKNFNEVKTFEDACKVERLDAKKVIPDFKAYPAKDRKAMIAHAKLVIIASALNRLANKVLPAFGLTSTFFGTRVRVAALAFALSRVKWASMQASSLSNCIRTIL